MRRAVKDTLLIAISSIAGAIWGAVKICRKMTKSIEKMEESKSKFKGYYDLMVCWMNLKHRGIHLSESLIKQNIHSVAIYGMGELGKCLLLELKDSEIQIAYGVDQDVAGDIEGIEIVEPTSDLEAVDAIIVTPVHAFDKIEKVLESKVPCPVLSLESLVFGARRK